MGTSDQYKVFDSILEWSPTLRLVLGPPGVPISLKSVFLETPCIYVYESKGRIVIIIVSVLKAVFVPELEEFNPRKEESSSLLRLY